MYKNSYSGEYLIKNIEFARKNRITAWFLVENKLQILKHEIELTSQFYSFVS
jgi:hypothetical protein